MLIRVLIYCFVNEYALTAAGRKILFMNHVDSLFSILRRTLKSFVYKGNLGALEAEFACSRLIKLKGMLFNVSISKTLILDRFCACLGVSYKPVLFLSKTFVVCPCMLYCMI